MCPNLPTPRPRIISPSSERGAEKFRGGSLRVGRKREGEETGDLCGNLTFSGVSNSITFPSLRTRIRSESMIVLILCAIVKIVRSANSVRMVSWRNLSVSTSTLAVAILSVRIPVESVGTFVEDENSGGCKESSCQTHETALATR